jgi:transmembrane sensor
MNRETAARIERDAAQWLMRMDREGRTPAFAEELEAWLAGDPRRRGAWLQAEAAWALLDDLASPPAAAGKFANEYAERARRHADVANDDDLSADEDGHGAPRRFGRRSLLIGGGAAALAASFVGGLLLLGGKEHYATAVGEIRRLPLADGSTAAINTQSEVTIAFDRGRRTVALDRGEAFFQVAHDTSRPFLVEAGRIRVLAVGTAFSVRRRDGGADVLVTQGVVEAWAAGAEGARVRLIAGERAFVADNAAVTRPQQAAAGDVDRALAWRSGRIDLAGETLEHAAAEFNRHNRRPIVIADPRIVGERFYGVFRTDDPEGFALSVNQSLNVPVHAGPAEIRIGRPPS